MIKGLYKYRQVITPDRIEIITIPNWKTRLIYWRRWSYFLDLPFTSINEIKVGKKMGVKTLFITNTRGQVHVCIERASKEQLVKLFKLEEEFQTKDQNQEKT